MALGVAGGAAGSPLCICSQEAKVRLWLTPGGQAVFSYPPPRPLSRALPVLCHDGVWLAFQSQRLGPRSSLSWGKVGGKKMTATPSLTHQSLNIRDLKSGQNGPNRCGVLPTAVTSRLLSPFLTSVHPRPKILPDPIKSPSLVSLMDFARTTLQPYLLCSHSSDL